MWMPNMKNVNIKEEEEETWELARAFAEDTRRNTNWPPRSYSCTYCRREFRSAQALGGHMNVHRRERARLHHEAQAQAQTWSLTTGPTSLFYQLANNAESNSLPVITTSSYYTNYDEMQVTERSHLVTKRHDHEKVAPIEELDLELRLGHTITTPAIYGKLIQKNSSNVSVVNFR